MRRGIVNTVLLAALAVTIGLNIWLRQPTTQRALEFMPDMTRTARFNAYEANPIFADGATLRPPVPGTIPRGLAPLGYAPTRLDALRAGEELVNPFSADDEAALARGAALYEGVCRPCHGADGSGGGAVVDRGFPAPPSLLRSLTRGRKDGHMFHILTYGQSAMASYAAQLSRDDRWRVILYLRALQRQSDSGAP